MRIVTTREVARQTREMFELAEKEDVVVKRGQKYFQIIEKEKPNSKLVSDEWLDEFFKIPAEYRCNPFDVSPSGDLFFGDKRNLEHIDKAIKQAENGQTRRFSKEAQEELFRL